MKFTFIIVSYNEKEYLEQAIDSCLKQNLNDFEIVIGDDGSNDGSIELIKQYVEQYPEIIRYSVSDRTGIESTKDIIASLRVSAVITRSLEMANGEYCVILSGDDYFYEGNFFQNAISFLDRNPNYVTYVGGYEKVWDERPPIADFITYPRKIYWARKYVHLSTFVFRRSVFEKGAFLQRFCDDTGLQYSLAFSGKWKCVNTIMFAYRQRSGSIMHTADPLQNPVVELMIFQDVLCKGFLYCQSLAKYGRALRTVFKNRQLLKEKKYRKYLLNCEKYDCNLLKRIYEYDNSTILNKIAFQMWMMCSKVLEIYYRMIGRMINVVHKYVSKNIKETKK